VGGWVGAHTDRGAGEAEGRCGCRQDVPEALAEQSLGLPAPPRSGAAGGRPAAGFGASRPCWLTATRPRVYRPDPS
jgi:hypothetical protein